MKFGALVGLQRQGSVAHLAVVAVDGFVLVALPAEDPRLVSVGVQTIFNPAIKAAGVN